MNDIVRARLVDALQERGYFSAKNREAAAEGLVDVLLSLPGIAIVELPEEGAVDNWQGCGMDQYVEDHPEQARDLAAAILAAANAADE